MNFKTQTEVFLFDEQAVDEWRTINEVIDAYYNPYLNEECLCTALIGTWQGQVEGGKVGTLKSIVSRILDNVDAYTFIQTEYCLEIITHYHDGTSKYCICLLTKKGLAWYNNNKDRLSPREINKHLEQVKCYTKRLKAI